MKKITCLLLTAVLLAGCSPEDLFSLIARSDIEEAASQSVSQSSDAIDKIDQKIQSLKTQYTKTAKLESVLKDGSYAYAFNQASENQFQHHVVAVLPPPTAEAFYEGWLVDPKTQKVISTGRFEFNKDDSTRELTFESKTDYTTYSKVVITLENTADQTPEKHILEGQF